MRYRAIAMIGASVLATVMAPDAAPQEENMPAGFLIERVEIDGVEMKGAVYRPPGLESPAPTILFLHGYGECGTDGSRQLTAGLPVAVMLEPERWPFVIVMPQKPTHNSEWEDYEGHVFAMLDLAAEKHGADPDRVAITGLSQGGHGTIAIASRNPERFVAAAPVCGYVERWNTEGDRKIVATRADDPDLEGAAEGLAGMPVWIFHGAKDDVVQPEEARLLHEALTKRGADVELTVYPDADHNSWDQAYRESGVWDWFTEHATRSR